MTGVEFVLIPVIIALVDWGMPLPAEFIEERVQVCEDQGTHPKLLWTDDYWPVKLPIENSVRGVRCVKPPLLEQPVVDVEAPVILIPVDQEEPIVTELFN